MKTILRFTWILAAALACCSPTEKPGDCNSNADCDPGFYCSPDHICLCETDNSCPEDEFCNANGYCQPYLGCRVDADCGEAGDWRCEITASGEGRCLCQTDAACEDGEFCNTSGACQPKAGCILDSDCGPAEAWRCRINPETSIGECFCQTDAACDEAEFCNVHGYCQPNAGCETNEDCQAGRFCNVATHECLCHYEAQTGCDPGEVCNASGYCQPRPGCYDNDDCEDLPDTYCDCTTRTCAPNGSCESDLQCPLGTICRQNQCVEGCNDGSDCPLDKLCSNFECVPGCQADEFCDLMEYCVGGTCNSDYSANKPYCKSCNPALGDCGNAANHCIIYNNGPDDFCAENESCNYCGIDCTADSRCPNGFECGDLIIISGQCSAEVGDECPEPTSCPGGLPCVKGPEQLCGYCPCHDTLNPCEECFLGFMCMYSMNPCSSNADCLQCTEFDGENYGYCLFGRVCGLNEGLHCP